METNNNNKLDKSEILFLYESSYSQPNGDPFTREQRYDEETKKILVSDVRIKRFIRDYFIERDSEEIVYVQDDYLPEDKSGDAQGDATDEDDDNTGKGQGSELRMKKLRSDFKNDPSVKTEKVSDETLAPLLENMRNISGNTSGDTLPNEQLLRSIQQDLSQRKGREEKTLSGKIEKYLKAKEDSEKKKEGDALIKALKGYIKKKGQPALDAEKILKKCIDVRLFGGISTEKGYTAQLTGPVQFAMLNPSLNRVDLRMHQITSVFASRGEAKQGTIGTTSLVPYAVCQIHGWINRLAAKHTDLQQADIAKMFKALWVSINDANTRSKSNQNSLLLLQIVYADENKKLYNIDNLIKLQPKNGMEHEEIRNSDDYTLDFSELMKRIAASDAVREVQFYTEHERISSEFANAAKFKPMGFFQ